MASQNEVNLDATVYNIPCFRNNTRTLAVVNVSAIAPTNSDIPATNEKYDVILLVDVSGSMSSSINNVKATIHAVRRLVSTAASITVITFNHDVKVIYSEVLSEIMERDLNQELKLLLASSLGDDTRKFEEKIDSITADGLTNIGDALKLGMVFQRPVRTLMILLSDGNPTVGIQNQEELKKITDDRLRKFTVFNTIGYGKDYDPNLLSKLGHFTYVENAEVISSAIGSMIGMIETTFGFDCRLILDRWGNEVIGATTFSPLYYGREYSYAQYIAVSDIKNIKGRSVLLSYLTPYGTIKTTCTEFKQIEAEPPAELKRLYYEMEANILAQDIRVTSNPRLILDRIDKWSEEGKAAAERVRAALHNYDSHALNATISSGQRQIAHVQDYGIAGNFMTQRQTQSASNARNEYYHAMDRYG